MKKKILIVEDERIIGEDIKRTLYNFGYSVPEVAHSGIDALSKAEKILPDLVLMDIVLDGDMSGIEAAEKIGDDLSIPVIYLTAYADEKTLRQARVTNPFGYILKPFEERELHTAIEMAFYKYKMDRALKESERMLKSIIDTDPNIIFVKDKELKYRVVNKSMADLYGLSKEDMIGKSDIDLVKISRIGHIDAKKYHKDDLKILDNRKKKHISEISFTRENGDIRWFQITKLHTTLQDISDAILGVAVDISERKKAEEDLKKSYQELEKMLEGSVSCLVTAVEVRDPYTAGHQKKVSQLATALAEKMKLPKNFIAGVRMAAMVHDIGKIYVPSEILTKPGKLLDVEFDLIKIHPQAGYDILKPINFPWPVADIVLQHQERYDGSSYPNGLKGEEIMLEARILAVADTIQAMASFRPYRQSLGIEEALKEIKTNRGKLFDPDVVDSCLSLFYQDRFIFEN